MHIRKEEKGKKGKAESELWIKTVFTGNWHKSLIKDKTEERNPHSERVINIFLKTYLFY